MYYRNIICPLDGTELMDRALEAAQYLVKLSDAKLILINVVEKWYRAEEVATDSKEWQALHNGWMEEGKTIVREAAERVKKNGVKRVDMLISEGDAAYEIVAVAKERVADLIVMSCHRHSAVANFFEDSVIERVTRNAPCPVFMIME
ncbi:universal stress protein [bacterium]|nr:MAG: universal stress protein [bacterium]